MRFALLFAVLALTIAKWPTLAAYLPAHLQGGIGMALVLGLIYGAFNPTDA